MPNQHEQSDVLCVDWFVTKCIQNPAWYNKRRVFLAICRLECQNIDNQCIEIQSKVVYDRQVNQYQLSKATYDRDIALAKLADEKASAEVGFRIRNYNFILCFLKNRSFGRIIAIPDMDMVDPLLLRVVRKQISISAFDYEVRNPCCKPLYEQLSGFANEKSYVLPTNPPSPAHHSHAPKSHPLPLSSRCSSTRNDWPAARAP